MKLFRFFLSVVVSACMSVAAVAQQYEHGEGPMENGAFDHVLRLKAGKVYSTLWYFSPYPDSGDMGIYFFKTQSPVGRKILSECLPDMYCRVVGKSGEDARSVEGKIPSGIDLDYDFAFIEEIISVSKAKIANDVMYFENDLGSDFKNKYKYLRSMKTRFGKLSADNNQVLRFKGRPVQPEVRGAVLLTLPARFELVRQDVVLAQTGEGTSCAGVFRFLTVSSSGVQVSPEFGTCSGYYNVLQREDGAIVLHAAEHADSGTSRMRRVDYVFRKGVLTENGKVVRP